jgi:hypothetical protein
VSNPYRDKLLSIGIISSRSRPSVSEGRHAATGIAYKVTTDDSGVTVDHDLGSSRIDKQDGQAPVETSGYKPGPVTLSDLAE